MVGDVRNFNPFPPGTELVISETGERLTYVNYSVKREFFLALVLAVVISRTTRLVVHTEEQENGRPKIWYHPEWWLSVLDSIERYVQRPEGNFRARCLARMINAQKLAPPEGKLLSSHFATALNDAVELFLMCMHRLRERTREYVGILDAGGEGPCYAFDHALIEEVRLTLAIPYHAKLMSHYLSLVAVPDMPASADEQDGDE